MAAFTCPRCSRPGPFEHLITVRQAIEVEISGADEDGYVARIVEDAVATEDTTDNDYRCVSCTYEFGARDIRLVFG
jgi:hypothetical protein